jgi:predicted DNA-binding WGR domain protein
MQKEQKKIFLVLETWERDGDHEGSPEVAAFSNREAARLRLKRLVQQDNRTGITEDIDDPDEKWEVIDEPDHYYAFNESANNWVDFQVVEMDVLDNDEDSADTCAVRAALYGRSVTGEEWLALFPNEACQTCASTGCLWSPVAMGRLKAMFSNASQNS